MKLILVFCLIFFVDFLTKYWVSNHLPLIQVYQGYPFGGVGVLDTSWLKISIVYTINHGTAWGLFSNYQGVLLFLRILITASLLGYLIFAKPPKSVQLPLVAICAGAFGNIFDVLAYGHVIDMFYFIFYKYSYPIFNVADAAIFVSVVYLLFSRKKKGRHAKGS